MFLREKLMEGRFMKTLSILPHKLHYMLGGSSRLESSNVFLLPMLHWCGGLCCCKN